MKCFIKQSFRICTIIFISLAFIVSMSVWDTIEEINSIEKSPVTVFSDEEFKEGFEEVVDFTKLSRYYEISYSENFENSDIILTSDFNNIDKSNDYTILGHSPLICVMKESENLNNYLIENNENGFLISDSKIKNKGNDEIDCDFTKIVEGVISGKNWNYFGGEDKEIKIYCPSENTINGKIFEEFLFKSLKNNLNLSDEEINTKIEAFFNSDNVIRTDVEYKLKLLKESVSEYEIFIEFESEFMQYYQTDSAHHGLTVIYPQTTILKQIYLQYKSENEDLKERLIKEDAWFGTKDILHKFYNKYYYRLGETGTLRSIEYSTNVQEGIDIF